VVQKNLAIAVRDSFLRTLLSYIKNTYLPEKRHNPKYPDRFTSGDLHFFAPAVADLSALFTFDRSARHANYFNSKEARSSYLLYFLIPNMLKVEWILKQQRVAELFVNEPEVRIADIGCGPCTGLLAASQYWQQHAPQQKLNCVGVDQNAASLKDGATLLKKLTPAASAAQLTTHAANITTSELRKKLGKQKFHVLILANVLNEFGGMEERYKFVRMLVETHLEPNGRLIIVEPALQRATRDLMLLRDQLVSPPPKGEGRGEGAAPIAQVLAPCLHQALCPMRAHNPRDWCHTYINWERPQIIADLDMLIGNKKDYLKMSYMVMASLSHKERVGVRGKPLNMLPSPPPLGEGIWRVVSAPMKSKGKLEILFCGQKSGKLLRVTRQDKDRSPKNVALDTLQRGDIVEYAGDAKCGREAIVRVN
jgi:ribosomal protein RSM22 (predicted rRNA methylase)